MKSKIGIVLVVVSLMIVMPITAANFLASATPVVHGVPKAVVLEKTFAFGDLLEGNLVTHGYTIANQGSAPLKIFDVRTSCGCTTVKLPDEIPPNSQDQIVVRADTTGRGGEQFHRTIDLQTNDPKQSRIQLVIEGAVHRFANLDRRHISLQGAIGKTLSAEATIALEKRYPFQIKATELDPDLIGKLQVQVEKHAGAYKINVRNILSEPGRYKGRIVLKTDSHIKPEFTIFVRGFIYAM